MITTVEQQTPFPANLEIPHPIRLVKEAEQQITRENCLITPENHSTLEQHHVAGKDNFPDTVTLCLTCHSKLSNIYQPKWLGRWSRLACYYFGWSDIFELLEQTSHEQYFHELSKKFTQNARYAR